MTKTEEALKELNGLLHGITAWSDRRIDEAEMQIYAAAQRGMLVLHDIRKAIATRTPEGQEMWAVEDNGFLYDIHDNPNTCRLLTDIRGGKVVPVIVTKKED